MSLERKPSKVAGEPPPDGKPFHVGAHVVRVSSTNARWHVTVDAAAFDRWFTSEAEAWAAGVREADRLQRLADS
ncbi:hypothetical protein [Anaeromyxobacter diazotrophicus]|uniref:hypothetical protein n=1 Tax=Anaeromyxobacter diazotrophicus TaxID=2590199 RepID=UPI001590BDA2|nr:hypothetical protein [Anaeromyxobacter diazotrophicus]